VGCDRSGTLNTRIALETLFIFLLLVANGVFAMAEIAIVSSRKPRLQQQAEDGEPGAQTALKLAEAPNRFLSTVQIGITLVGIFAGAYGGATLTEQLAAWLSRVTVLQPYAQGIALALVVLLITYFSLIIGELIPKRIALNNPEAIAVRLARPMNLLSRLAAPLVSLLTASTEVGLRLLGVKPSSEPPVTEEEVRVMVEQGARVGVFESFEQDVIESLFRLSDRGVDAIMTPRTEIVWLDLNAPLEENLGIITETQFSRFPVALGNLDNVQGILRSKDALITRIRGTEPLDLLSLVTPPLFVPESTPAFRVLEQMRQTGIHLALMINEFGGIEGMVTLFDMLEAIVGDLPVQGEAVHEEIVRREDGSWLVDGLMAMDELRAELDIKELPGEDRMGYKTVGGFVMARLGVVPAPGQSFNWGGLRFEVMDMDGHRVDKVLVTLLDK